MQSSVDLYKNVSSYSCHRFQTDFSGALLIGSRPAKPTVSHVLKIVIRSLGLALYCMLQFEPRGQKVLLLIVYVIYYDLKVENVLNMHPCVGKCVEYAYICIVLGHCTVCFSLNQEARKLCCL